MKKFNTTLLITVLILCHTLILYSEPKEFKANTYTESYQEYPCVAMDGSGNFVIAWQSYDQDGDSYGIFAQRFDNNANPLGFEFRVNTTTQFEQEYPTIAMNNVGLFVIIWHSVLSNPDNPSEDEGIFAKCFDKDGIPTSDEIQVNSYKTKQVSLSDPSVGIDNWGNFVVAWGTYIQDGDKDVFAQKCDRFGNFIGEGFKVNTYTKYDQRYPSVSVSGTGNFIIAWESDGQSGICAQMYDVACNPIKSEFKVNINPQYNSLSIPSVAINDGGSFVVVWSDQKEPNSSECGIYARRFGGIDDPIGSEILVNTNPIKNIVKLSVDLDNSKNFIITWDREENGSAMNGKGVYAKKLDFDGTVFGDEFQVNTYIESSQRSPSVAMVDTDNFVITWEDSGQSGIYAKLYKEGQQQKTLEFGLKLDPEKTSYSNGNKIKLLVDIQSPSNPINVDLYFVMLNPANTAYFGMDWNTTPKSLLNNFTVPANLSIAGAPLLEITIPNSKPPIGTTGTYIFAIGAAEHGTVNFISNIAIASFEVK
jgi:hypothetical protein